MQGLRKQRDYSDMIQVTLPTDCYDKMFSGCMLPYEVGGFLLGYFSDNHYDIKHVLLIDNRGHHSTFCAEQTDFENQLDLQLAQNPDWCILGIWHTHPFGDDHFSLVDNETNTAYSRVLGDCISALVTVQSGVLINVVAHGVATRLSKHEKEIEGRWIYAKEGSS